MADLYVARTQRQIYEALEQYLIGLTSPLSNFNVGGRLRSLLEAISIVEAQTQFDFWSALRDSIPISAIEGFGFTRLPGTKSVGKLVFTRGSAATAIYAVPIGTRVVLGNYEYATTAAGSILVGFTSSAALAAECTTVGDSNIPAGAIDTLNGLGSLVSPPTGIQYVNNSADAFVGGIAEETNEERLARFTLFVQNLGRCTVNGLKAGALSVALPTERVRSATIREYYPAPGWNTVYVDNGSGTASAALRAEVLKVLNGDQFDPTNYWGYRAAGIFVQVLSPILKTQNIALSVTISTLSTSTDAAIQAAVTTAIDNYVNTLSMGADIIFSELITAVQNAHEDIYDVVFTAPTTNVSIAINEVGRTGTVTIVVTRATIPT